MKIYFDFNIKQTLLCHEMAKYWKKHYGIKDFAGAVVVHNGKHYNFLKRQKDINYKYIDNRDEIEKEALKKELDVEKLKEIEKKLDIPLWYFVVADRNIGHSFVKGADLPISKMMKIVNHENVMKMVLHFYEFYDRRLDKFKPDAVIFTAMASLPPLILAKICEMKKIPYYILKSTRVKKLYTIIRNSYKEESYDIEKDFKKILKSKNFNSSAIKYVESFIKTPESPEYAKGNKKKIELLKRKNILSILFSRGLYLGIRIAKAGIKYCLNLTTKEESFLRDKGKMSKWWLNTKKELFPKILLNKTCNQKLDFSEKYVYYPLHLNPEASTMILAPNFVNQLNVIEILAKNIPITHKLYVKEHIPNLGTRPRGFYKELKKYPNVKLISPGEDTFSLIRNASLVATISGTAAWEAVLIGIPAITFSRSFYSIAGLSEYCTDLNEVGPKIKKLIYEKNSINKEERKIRLKSFVSAVFNNSFPCDVSSIVWGKQKEYSKILKEKKEDVAILAEQYMNSIKRDKPQS